MYRNPQSRSQLREEDQERLARLLLDEMESDQQLEGSDALTRNSSELVAPNGELTKLAEEERTSATSRVLWAMARGALAVTDFAILQFMRTRAGERTIRPTQRRSYPPRTKRTLFERQNRQCIICGKRRTIKNFQIDHIVPTVRGGPDNVTNFQLLCPPCNQRKGIHTNQEFYERYKRVVSGNLLHFPPAPPPQEITQKALREETQRTSTHASVQQFKRTKYISASTKIKSGSLTTGAVTGGGWFLGWPLVFPHGGDLVANLALFGGIFIGAAVCTGIIWRAKHSGMYDL